MCECDQKVCTYLNSTYSFQSQSKTLLFCEIIFSATLIIGFLPHELLGASMYEYYHHDDISNLAESHKVALQNQGTIQTQVNCIHHQDLL